MFISVINITSPERNEHCHCQHPFENASLICVSGVNIFSVFDLVQACFDGSDITRLPYVFQLSENAVAKESL